LKFGERKREESNRKRNRQSERIRGLWMGKGRYMRNRQRKRKVGKREREE
jgi:hypothetical protein